MAETRVNKYKQYRDSFTKEQTFVKSASSITKEDKNSIKLTNTLSLESVIGETDNEIEIKEMKRWKKNTIIKFCIIGVIAIVIAVLLTILGINAFGGK